MASRENDDEMCSISTSIETKCATDEEEDFVVKR